MAMTLKAARINKNLTQQQAAKLLNVSRFTVSNWEKGKSYPDASKIKKIEETYEIEYDSIIFLH